MTLQGCWKVFKRERTCSLVFRVAPSVRQSGLERDEVKSPASWLFSLRSLFQLLDPLASADSIAVCVVVAQPVAHQAPLSMGFSRQEYRSGLSCPPPGDLPNPEMEPRSLTLQADSLPSEPPGKPKNSRVDSLSLLQGSFLTQVSNWGVLHYREILYQLSYQGSPAGSSVHDCSPFSYWFCTFLNINFVHGFVLLSTFCPATTRVRIACDIWVPFDYLTMLGTQTPSSWPQHIWPSTEKRTLSCRVSAWTTQSLFLRDVVFDMQ